MNKVIKLLVGVCLVFCSSIAKAEIYDCIIAGDLTYGSESINNFKSAPILKRTAIEPSTVRINLSGFIPQDKKVVSPIFNDGLILGPDEEFNIKLLMIKDEVNNGVIAYISTFRGIDEHRTFSLGSSRIKISGLNDSFSFGLVQRPYWFIRNNHMESLLIVSTFCSAVENFEL